MSAVFQQIVTNVGNCCAMDLYGQYSVLKIEVNDEGSLALLVRKFNYDVPVG